MKRLLWIFAIVLLFSCVSSNIIPPRTDNYAYQNCASDSSYFKRGPWESPFNPHEIFESWNKISAEYVGPGAVEMVAGNPKINWEKIKLERNHEYTEVAIPEGEFASAVAFLFALRGRIIHLMGYAYYDIDGILYVYAWNNEKASYIRMPHVDLQKCI
jgi:hypothetical protein